MTDEQRYPVRLRGDLRTNEGVIPIEITAKAELVMGTVTDEDYYPFDRPDIVIHGGTRVTCRVEIDYNDPKGVLQMYGSSASTALKAFDARSKRLGTSVENYMERRLAGELRDATSDLGKARASLTEALYRLTSAPHGVDGKELLAILRKGLS